jgi:hypothetical protein
VGPQVAFLGIFTAPQGALLEIFVGIMVPGPQSALVVLDASVFVLFVPGIAFTVVKGINALELAIRVLGAGIVVGACCSTTNWGRIHNLGTGQCQNQHKRQDSGKHCAKNLNQLFSIARDILLRNCEKDDVLEKQSDPRTRVDTLLRTCEPLTSYVNLRHSSDIANLQSCTPLSNQLRDTSLLCDAFDPRKASDSQLEACWMGTPRFTSQRKYLQLMDDHAKQGFKHTAQHGVT